MADEKQLDMGDPATPSSPHASHGAASVSAVPVSVPIAGEWAVFVESPRWRRYRYAVRQISSVTKLLVKLDRSSWPRQISKEDLCACLPDKEAAEKLCQALNGVGGEYERRDGAAHQDYVERKNAAAIAAEKQIARLIASVIGGRND